MGQAVRMGMDSAKRILLRIPGAEGQLQVEVQHAAQETVLADPAGHVEVTASLCGPIRCRIRHSVV